MAAIGIGVPEIVLLLILPIVVIGVTWSRYRKSRSSGTPPPNPPVPARVFISYRHGASNDVTARIYDRLVQHFGEGTVFKDVDSLRMGDDFRDKLRQAVRECGVLLAIISHDWRGENEGRFRIDDPEDFVRIEIETALTIAVPIIPVLVQGTKIPREDELPPILKPLAYRQRTEVRADPDFHHDVDRLIQGIEQHVNGTR